MIKKILITGASGYLGRNLLKYFKKKNYHISIISKKKSMEQLILAMI